MAKALNPDNATDLTALNLLRERAAMRNNHILEPADPGPDPDPIDAEIDAAYAADEENDRIAAFHAGVTKMKERCEAILARPAVIEV